MYRRDFLARFALSSLALRGISSAQAPGRELPLTIEDVVKLARAGFSEEIIVTKIKKNAKAFDLNSDELADLKKAGVSDVVVKYLLDPALPYTPPPPPAPAGGAAGKPGEPPKKYPADAYSARVPGDPGLYFFPTSAPAQPVKIDLKFLLGTEQPKKLLKKGKSAGYLIGPSAKTRVHNPSQAFYVRLADGKEIEELVLVNLSDKNGRRELQMKAEGICPRETLEVGARLFRINPQKLASAEYLFFLLGSADPTKGIYGKGYDFGVDTK